MYSDGRCPLCGHKGAWAGTIVDCTEHAVEYDARADAFRPYKLAIAAIAFIGACAIGMAIWEIIKLKTP